LKANKNKGNNLKKSDALIKRSTFEINFKISLHEKFITGNQNPALSYVPAHPFILFLAPLSPRIKGRKTDKDGRRGT
jgi:hypothetical protein